MPFLLSLKVYSDFQRKENNTPCKRNNQSGWKSDGPVLPRFPITAICINSCYFLSMFCPSAHNLLSEARGHHATVHTGSPREPNDPTSAGYLLPSRSTGVTPSPTPSNSSSPFQCSSASIPSPSLPSIYRMIPSQLHWETVKAIQHDLTKLPFLSVYNACLSSILSQRKKYPFSFPSLVLCLCLWILPRTMFH